MPGTQTIAGNSSFNRQNTPGINQQLTIDQVAEITGTSARTVRRWISQGKLRAYRYGPRVLRIDEGDLLAMREQIAPATFYHVNGGDAA